MEAWIEWHRRRYPAMEAEDEVKLLFQAALGCGHLLAEEDAVVRRIVDEEHALVPDSSEPLTEPLGGRYIRLNLRRAMAEGIRPEWIARMMRLSPAPVATRAEVAQDERLGADARRVAQQLVENQDWLPGHSAAYRAAYAPAYRVIGREYLAALPVLSALARLWNRPRLLLCIDGPCGSGKTTLSHLLAPVLQAEVVSMDDFFLPHGRKMPERLSRPGGNADWERVLEEFLHPWQTAGRASYRPYDCHTDSFLPARTVDSARIAVLEGSYSLLPALGGRADLRVFLTVNPQEQRRRILERNGPEALQSFVTRWIPLEQAYFSACSLPDASCLTLDNSAVQEV